MWTACESACMDPCESAWKCMHACQCINGLILIKKIKIKLYFKK